MKYSTFGIAVFIAVGILAFIFWPKSFNVEDVKNYPPKSSTVVAFGDSLVEGVGSVDEGFVSDLENRLRIDIINEGISGNTTQQGLERIDDVLSYDPGVVILLLGGNDYLRKIDDSQTERNLSTIIKRLQDDGIVVILLGVRGGALKDNFKDMYKDLAKQYDTAFVSNVLAGLITNPELMYDSIHPNDSGYELIADRVEPILREVLR